MSFKRKCARKDISHIEKTARPYGNRIERRNRNRHKARQWKFQVTPDNLQAVCSNGKPFCGT